MSAPSARAAPARSKRPRRLGLIIPWLLFAALALGWTGYWFILRTQMIAAIEAGLARQRAAGASIEHGPVSASGYPLRLTLRYDGPRYEAAGGGWAVSAPSLDLHVNPTDLSLVIVEPRGPIVWRNKAITRTLRPRVAAISIRMRDNALAELRASAEDLTVTAQTGLPGVMKAAILAVRPDPRQANDLQVSLDIDALTLARAPSGFEGLGGAIDKISARVVIREAGAATGAAALDAWRRAGGVAQVDSVGLQWGPARLSGAGPLSLDEAGRPAGQLELKLTTDGPTPAMNPMLHGVFAAAAQVSRVSGQPTPITLRLESGVLKLGDLPLRPLDRIE